MAITMQPDSAEITSAVKRGLNRGQQVVTEAGKRGFQMHRKPIPFEQFPDRLPAKAFNRQRRA